MIILKPGLLALVILLWCVEAGAQRKELTIGDRAPNIQLTRYEKGRVTKARLFDFKSDLLILDFWATWCGPCIAMFPRVDSIEKALKGRVRFLPVTYEDRKKVGTFLKTMNSTRMTDIASVVEDTVLSRLFRYQSIPHYVWLDKNDKVVAITDKAEITKENVELALAGKLATIKIKPESERSMDIMKRAFDESVTIIYGGDTANKKKELLPRDKVLYRSVFTGPIPGVWGYTRFELHSFTFINASPLLLLSDYWGLKKKYRYNINEFLGQGRIALELRDTMTEYRLSGGYLRYLHNSRAWQEWGEKYGVCYELVLPDSTSVERKEELMEQDLRRYFRDLYKVTFDVESRRTKILVLKMIGAGESLETSGGPALEDCTRYYIDIKNRPFRFFVDRVRDIYRHSYPIIDETGIEGKVDIKLEVDMLNIDLLNEQLKKYGLQLSLDEREMDVLVVKDAA